MRDRRWGDRVPSRDNRPLAASHNTEAVAGVELASGPRGRLAVDSGRAFAHHEFRLAAGAGEADGLDRLGQGDVIAAQGQGCRRRFVSHRIVHSVRERRLRYMVCLGRALRRRTAADSLSRWGKRSSTMKTLAKMYRGQYRAVEDALEAWKSDHDEAMSVCDLEEVVRTCLRLNDSARELVRSAWELGFAGK